ncbi:MAG: Gfo/Idh/MocA family oxidoreductase, partial [Glaciihabitans sp.]|nr:Gfo/Idh/MocA family oxidoreductase [Glaciihabitans sp.]
MNHRTNLHQRTPRPDVAVVCVTTHHVPTTDHTTHREDCTNMTTQNLRIAVVGAGMMGSDHIQRITHRISGAEVVTVVEPDEGRAKAAVADLPGATT